MMDMQYLFASSSFDVRALASMYWDQGDYSEFLKFAHLGLQHKDPSSCTSVYLLYYCFTITKEQILTPEELTARPTPRNPALPHPFL